MELLAVVVLMSIFAGIGMARYGRSTFAEFGARGEVRELSLALLAAQRASIRSGDNHFVEFDAVQAKNYRLMRRTGSSVVEVQGWEPLSSDVKLTVSDTAMEFTFEGQTLLLKQYTIDGVGVDRSFRLTVVPITGSLQITETT